MGRKDARRLLHVIAVLLLLATIFLDLKEHRLMAVVLAVGFFFIGEAVDGTLGEQLA